MQTSVFTSTNERGSKFFGSITGVIDVREDLELVGDADVVTVGGDAIEMALPRTWLSTNGSIILCSRAIRLIQLSGLIVIVERHHRERQQNTEQNRRTRGNERDRPSPYREITGQPEQWDTRHHGKADYQKLLRQ